MDVLLGFPSDTLERNTPSLPAFCLPIISLMQLASEVVWIDRLRGLGMPQHRKTRLLHWPAYRLLFLIRVLNWKQILCLSNRIQGVVIFFYFQTFSHHYSCPDCWCPGAEHIGISINYASTNLGTSKTGPRFKSWPTLLLKILQKY